ncbi:MAG: hypothetical protein EBT03_09855, partial [Betaproteobacteria bacterium]|nr:hypothetical protein [Betaproteobacteria bacterium]
MHEVLRKIYETEKAMSYGIVPLGVNVVRDINRILKDLPPEEARRMKRKFRKLWRKEARKVARGAQIQRGQMPIGYGAKNPTRRQKEARKRMIST